MAILQKIKEIFNSFELRPDSRAKVTLFRSRAEAIVFWLSLFGLLFWTVATAFRYFTWRQPFLDFQKAEQERNELALTVEELVRQNAAYQSRLDSLTRILAAPAADTSTVPDSLGR